MGFLRRIFRGKKTGPVTREQMQDEFIGFLVKKFSESENPREDISAYLAKILYSPLESGYVVRVAVDEILAGQAV